MGGRPGRVRLADGDVDAFAAAQTTLDGVEADDSINQGKKGVIRTPANIDARQHRGAALTNQNRASTDGLAAIALDAETLGIGVAAVAGGACAFLVGQG